MQVWMWSVGDSGTGEYRRQDSSNASAFRASMEYG